MKCCGQSVYGPCVTIRRKTHLLADSLEERRLAYAAITRARDRVYLSWPLLHQTRTLSRSPFLGEMPSLEALEVAVSE